MMIQLPTIDDMESMVNIEFANMTPFFQANPEWKIEFVRESVQDNFSRAWKLTDKTLMGFYYWVPDDDCADQSSRNRATDSGTEGIFH